ncbi:MAG TPA: hypothetical protein VHW23_44200, partial [Kofleriaceae bacterium]|nr:hypothetical protein [Kofleriaceae bacterium]
MLSMLFSRSRSPTPAVTHRARRLALVAAGLLAACSSHPSQGAGGAAGSGSADGSAGSGRQAAAPPKPASTLEQVTHGAPPDAKVAAAGLAVPGIDLFLVSDGKPPPEDEGMPPRVVGVAGGAGGTLLEGRDLVRAVIDAKADPRATAQVALWVAQDDGTILDAANTPEQ